MLFAFKMDGADYRQAVNNSEGLVFYWAADDGMAGDVS